MSEITHFCSSLAPKWEKMVAWVGALKMEWQHSAPDSCVEVVLVDELTELFSFMVVESKLFENLGFCSLKT